MPTARSTPLVTRPETKKVLTPKFEYTTIRPEQSKTIVVSDEDLCAVVTSFSEEEIISEKNGINSKSKVIGSRECLTYEHDNYVHFVSADGELVTPIGKILLDLGKTDPVKIKKKSLNIGQIAITPYGKNKIFSIVIKSRYFDKTNTQDIFIGLNNLKDTLIREGITSFRISRTGDATDDLAPNEFIKKINDLFSNTEISVTICYGKIQIPKNKDRLGIINEFHGSIMGGHRGVTKAYRKIRERFYWPLFRNDVQNFIRRCKSCQEQKFVQVKTREPMLITDTPTDVFDKVSLDTVGPLPETPHGNKHILTMQDQLSAYCLCEPIPDLKATTIAEAMAQRLIGQFGAPRAILTDCGAAFTSGSLREIANIFKIRQLTTSGYIPQTNGVLERSQIILTEYIKHYINKYDCWDRLLPYAEHSYNTGVHEATNFTPYEIVYGRLPRLPSKFPTEPKLSTYIAFTSE